MKKSKRYLSIFIRYAILVALGLSGLELFYIIFRPLTIYPTFFLLNLFYNTSLTGNIVLIENFLQIELIDACMAGSAYFLLLILNLSIPKTKLTKRIKMILFAFLSFLIINLIRIFILSLLAISKSSYFDVTHVLSWYALSIVFVIGIWFIEVKIFGIKEIPFYSDLKFIYKRSKFKRK